MRKLFVTTLVLAIPFMSAAACQHKDTICIPHATRHDPRQSDVDLVCNFDGTKEEPFLTPSRPAK